MRGISPTALPCLANDTVKFSAAVINAPTTDFEFNTLFAMVAIFILQLANSRSLQAVANGSAQSTNHVALTRFGRAFAEAGGPIALVSRFEQHQIEDFASPVRYSVACQVPSTKRASPSPGHGGIVAPITSSDSPPSLRN